MMTLKSNNNDKQEPEEQDSSDKSKLREYFESLIVAIILALIVKTFILQTFQIPTGSMEDGLLVGDHIIVNKFIYGDVLPMLEPILPVRDVKRGDVVIFKYPPDPSTDYIKRVIGLPGETIRIYQHQIFINGVPIEELGLDEDVYTLQWRNADTERAEKIGLGELYNPAMDPEAKRDLVFKVPSDDYFVMGDHRNISRDSRYWGTVPRKNITGRAIMIYWSHDAEREYYQETDIGQQIGNFLSTVISFPFKTRWDRFFRIIQ